MCSATLKMLTLATWEESVFFGPVDLSHLILKVLQLSIVVRWSADFIGADLQQTNFWVGEFPNLK